MKEKEKNRKRRDLLPDHRIRPNFPENLRILKIRGRQPF